MYSEKKLIPVIQYWCPNCDALLNKYDKFCHNCGKPLEWESSWQGSEEQKEFKRNLFSIVPDSCKTCPNHPINGGNGNCNCTLGLPKITC